MKDKIEEKLLKEITRLKKFPQDKSYKNMCVFDEVRVLKAKLKQHRETKKWVEEEGVRGWKIVKRLRKEVYEEVLDKIDNYFNKQKSRGWNAGTFEEMRKELRKEIENASK